MAQPPPPGSSPSNGSLFDRIPWKVVIPAGMQLANELRQAVRGFEERRGPGAAPPGGRQGGGAGPLPGELAQLHRRIDRLESHHEELGRLLERLAAQEAESNRAVQTLATRVAFWQAMSVVGLVVALVAVVVAAMQ